MLNRSSSFRFLLLLFSLVAATVSVAQVPLDSLERMYARTKYRQYIGKTEKELKALPKQDRPDLAVEQDFLRTSDPSLGRPAPERLVAARAYADLLRAQEAVPGDANNAWVERGPSNVGGRTRALVWDPTSVAAGGNKVWAGGVTGGLWYNNDITNSNSTWQSAGNAWDNIAISAMAFDPTNPQVAYVGTGEGWFAGSSRGAGVWKTTNGGQTWTQLSTTVGFLYINDIVVRNEGGVGVPYIAVDATFYAGQWSPGSSNLGVYRSTNGGTTWSKITLPTTSQAVSDLEIDAENTLWAGTRRSTSSFSDGGQIAKSTNGTSWSVVYTQPTSINGGRTELAVGGSGSGLRVYAVFEASSAAYRMFRSNDKGANWTQVNLPVDADLGIGADFTRGQAWYDLIMQVDPNNADIVYAGGIDLFRSTNGAVNWTQISKWSNNNNLASLSCPWVHADQHAIAFRPGSSSSVVFGNDGGVFYSGTISTAATNPSAILPRNTGYNVTQFYSCAMNPGSGSNNFLAGAQDNGTQRYTSAGMNATTDVIGGDGAYCFIDQTNANYQIGSYVYNNYYRSTNTGANFGQTILNDNNTGDFINAAGYDSKTNMLFTARTATTIYRVAGIETTPTTPTAVTITNLSSLATHLKVSPYAPTGTTTLYLGTETGEVLRVPNAHTGSTATGTVLANNLASGSVSCIEIGADENTLLVTYTNYGVNSVWMSTNGGSTWTSKEGNLPDMPIRWALIHPTNPNEALLATELGTWATSNLLASPPTWVPSNSGLANVRVDMLQYRSSDKMVAAATYGRGLFTSAGFAQTATVQADFLVSNSAPCQGQGIQLTDQSLGNPTAWSWSITPSGATFINGTSSTSQNPQVQFSAPGNYTIQLTASNSTSSDTKSVVGAVGVGQLGLPFTEDFETAANRARWTIINPDNSITWTFSSGVPNITGSTSAAIDHFNYAIQGNRDGLVSPPISLANAVNPVLSFRHAYRPYNNTTQYPDSMAVFVSTNCGGTWIRVASFKETNFTSTGSYTWNTGPSLSAGLFVPASTSEWCGNSANGNTYSTCKFIDLSAFSGQEIRVKFENINSYGQVFYLDDIGISANTTPPPVASFQSSSSTLCPSGSTTLNNTSTGTSNTYQWTVSPSTGFTFTSGNSSSLSPVLQFQTAGTYTVQLTATNAGGTSSTTQTITVYPYPQAPTGTNLQIFCSGATVGDLVATGLNLKWYTAVTGGTLLSNATALTDNTYYYATQTVNGCESFDRFEAYTWVYAQTPAPTGASTQTFCPSSTVGQLVATGTSIQWYATSTGGTALSNATLLVNNTTYYASQSISGCESPTRLAVLVTLANNTSAPTGSATQTFCGSATLSQLVVTGAGIKWYATSTGGTALALNTPLVAGTTYYASQTVSGCESSARLAVTVSTNGPAAPTGSAAQTHCPLSKIADLVVVGTSIKWYNSPTGGSQLSTTNSLINGSTYYASQTVGGCESSTRLGVTVTISTPAAPTGSAGQSFCNTGTVGQLTATGSGIQWYSASTGGTPLSTATSLVHGSTYYASQSVNGCESTTRLAVLVTIAQPAAPTGTTSQSFCNEATVAQLTATGTSISWYASSTGGSPLAASTALVGGSTYYASQTVSGCESLNRLAVTATVNAPAAPTGSSTQNFCGSGTVAQLSATGSNVQWYAAATGGSPFAGSTSLSNGVTYFASQTVNGCTSLSRLAVAVSVTVASVPTAVSPQLFCAGSNAKVSDLTASGTGILWYATASGGLPLASTTVLTLGQTYYASQTINGCESSSRKAVVTGTGSPTAPTGLAAQSFCNSGTVAQLAATGTGIKWYAASSGGSPLSNTTPLTNGTTYYASQTVSGCESSTRLAVAVSINAPAAPTGSATQSFCNSGTVSQLTATGSGIQWYAAASGGTALSAAAVLVNGTTYYASQTVSGCESNGRLAVTASIATPAAPTGPSTQTFCNSATVAQLSATGSALKWYSTSTGGVPLTTGTPLANGITYFASQTIGGCESSSRLSVLASINTPATPSGSATQTFCNSGTVAQLAASGTGIQWYASALGGSPLSASTPLVNNTVYYATQTLSGCESAARFAATAVLNVPAAPTGLSSQSFCNSGTVAQLTATGTGIQWYATASGGTALSGAVTLVSGTTYYASQTVNGCESSGRLAVTAAITVPAAPTGAASQSFCQSGTIGQLSATGTSIQWYLTNTGGTAVGAGTALNNGTTYYATQTVNGCESQSRLAVLVTLNTPVAPSGNATQTFCTSATVSQLTLVGTSIQWYATSTGGTPLSASTVLANGATYYASQTISGCESASRTPVLAVITTVPAPTGTSSQTVCNSGTLANLTVSGTGILWYATPTGGSPLASTTALVGNTTYYASQTASGCESPTRFAVLVTVFAPAAPTGSTIQSFCTGATVAQLSASGSGIQWYSAATGGSPLSLSTVLISGVTYYASQTVSNCESSSRLAVQVLVTTPAAPSAPASQSFCNTATLAQLTAAGSGILWYLTPSGGAPLPLTTALNNGSVYYASQTVNGCESALRTAVTAVLTSPLAPTGTASQSFCSNATVADLQATGTSIQWYSGPTGGVPLASSTLLISGSTYYASQTVGGCESNTRFAVVAVVVYPPGPTGTSVQTFCNAAFVYQLTATGTNIQWYATNVGGTPLTPLTPLVGGSAYFASQTVNGCESAIRFPVAVLMNTPASPTGSSVQTFCSGATVAQLVALGTNLQWYNANAGGSPLSTSAVLTNGTTYYATQTLSGCESAIRFPVVAIVNSTPAPTGSATQAFCNGGTVANLSAVGTGIQWFSAATGGAPLATTAPLINATTYYAEQTLNNCPSVSRLAVTAQVQPQPSAAILVQGPKDYCSNQTIATNFALSGLQPLSASAAWRRNGTTLAGATGTSYLATQSGYFDAVLESLPGCTTTVSGDSISIQTPPVLTPITGQTWAVQGVTQQYQVLGSSGGILQWTANGGVVMSGQGSPTVDVAWLANGTLEVKSTKGACVEIRSIAVVLSGVGVEEPTAPIQAVLFPNPTNRWAHIEPWTSACSVHVYAMDGRLLSVPCVAGNLDFDGFPAGLYQVVVQNPSERTQTHLRVQVQR